MTISDALNWRYATKRMNGEKVPQEKLDRILEAVRLAPSSYGLQPYSILVIESEALREQIKSVAYDQPQITESSHLLVFAAWDSVHDGHVDEFIQLTAKERDTDPADLEGYKNAIKGALKGFPSSSEKFHWAAKQVYIALGTALVTAAVEQVDASPMEGFDAASLDDLLGLKTQNLRSVVLMAVGYRDTDTDRLAGLKKVRRPKDEMFIHLVS